VPIRLGWRNTGLHGLWGARAVTLRRLLMHREVCAFPHLVEPPLACGQLVCGQQLGLVARHGVEDVEQRVLLELCEVARLQAWRVVQVARRHLQNARNAQRLLRWLCVLAMTQPMP
jgi:hypothetical protein